MYKSRPKNLNLLTIRFPIPAIASILHRISGFALFLMIPVVLWALSLSLTQDGFETLQQWFGYSCMKIITWVLLIPFFYHFVAGIRHLLMDVHVGSSLKAGRFSAFLTLVITFFLLILAGVWLW